MRVILTNLLNDVNLGGGGGVQHTLLQFDAQIIYILQECSNAVF